jgi:hypothetical protein
LSQITRILPHTAEGADKCGSVIASIAKSVGLPNSMFTARVRFGRTCNYSGQASGNNSEMLLPTPISWIISAFSISVQKIIVGIAFRQ